MSETVYIYIAILFCVTQSGITSGLTLSLFGFPRLRLESEASAGNEDAVRILKYRKDSHLLLATLIWSNVCFNVLLAFLTDSIMNAYVAFFFTTFLITFFGEIFPQAYISRKALKVGSKLSPLLAIYKFITYPLAKPTGLLLDKWIGKEGYDYYSEATIKQVLKRHLDASDSEMEKLEGQGALNFLTIDDMYVKDEGEIIDPDTIIKMDDSSFTSETNLGNIPDEVIIKLLKTKKKWGILISSDDFPQYALNIDPLIKDYYLKKHDLQVKDFCHEPILVTDPSQKLGDTILNFKVIQEHGEDDVVDFDTIIYWTPKLRKIITGADVLGRLLRGAIKTRKPEL